LPVRAGIVTVSTPTTTTAGVPALDRRPPAPKSRREERRNRRLAERDAERERVRRKATRPAWQDPTALITGAALVVGLLLFVLLVVRPGSNDGAPASSDNPLGLIKPGVTIPAGLADGRALGKADAPVKVDVWSDFQCPFCGQFATVVEPQVISNLVTKGTVRLVAHDFSFLGSGRNPDESTDAAVGARCADRQGHFWDYYLMVFANQGSTENGGAYVRSRLLAMADLLGLDHAAFETCQADQTLRAAVVTETAQGTGLGVNSTPTVFVNGQKATSVRDYATLAALIAAVAPSASPSTGSTAGAPSPSAGSPASP
jgi:protein-disulfide isomerase